MRLELKLLGGFEARVGDRGVTSFESQKARALFAYLALHRGRPSEREFLAGLLWPDRPAASARRNLRQVLHNLRTAFAEAGAPTVLDSSHRTVRIDPDLECWIDVESFEEAIHKGLDPAGHDPHQLATAARLYAGDLLAGFFLKDGGPFEEWMVGEQERLREEALEALRRLISAYVQRGEHRLGIQYARRLLALDPLSEEAHRDLMRLYVMAGRRNRALAQFEHLRNLLNTELGVEPVEETAELYRAVLLQEAPAAPGTLEEREPIGPLIPLVGRAEEFSRLQEIWAAVVDGAARLTLVVGEPGSGKSRLARSFVDGATSKRRAVVLAGRSYAASPLLPFRPLREMLTSAFADVLPDEGDGGERLSDDALADLARLAPELRELAPEFLGRTPRPDRARAERTVASLKEAVQVLIERTLPGQTTPLILLLEDLQLTDAATLDLLAELWQEIGALPVWILATSRTADLDHPLAAAAETVPVGRLAESAVEEIAQALVGAEAVPALASFLWRRSGGLPLRVTELINFLWDDGVLVPVGAGTWRLVGDPETDCSPPESLVDLIRLRIERLPASARRLLSLAAVIGQQFEAETLQAAADEHMAVVEVCVGLMLERWLIRQFPRSWSQSGRQRDVILFARGARRGSFEFAHRAIREATLEHLNPLRRGIVHGEAAAAIRQEHDTDPAAVAEVLAHHYAAAGEWRPALSCLEDSARKAEACGASTVASWYRERAVEVIERLASTADGPERQALERRREALLAGTGY